MLLDLNVHRLLWVSAGMGAKWGAIISRHQSTQSRLQRSTYLV